MTTKKITIGALFIYTACVFFACTSENDVIENHHVVDDSTVSFSSNIRQVSRGAEMTIATLREQGFMVFANSVATDWTTDGDTSTADFMYEQTVDYIEVESGVMRWEYSPLKYWPDNGRISFFAYSPHTLPPGEGAMTHSPKDTPGATNIIYTLPAEAAKQHDIVAASCKDCAIDTDAGEVHIDLKHVLSKIEFAARSTHELDSEASLEITKLEVLYRDGAIRNVAVLDLEDVQASLPRNIWQDASPRSRFTTGNLSAGNILGDDTGALASIHMDNTKKNITSKDACLMLIPQEYNRGDLKVSISYIFTEEDDQPASRSEQHIVDFEVNIPKITGGWLPGVQYTYLLNIGPDEVTCDNNVTVSDWNDGSMYRAGVETPVIYPTSSYTLSEDGAVLKKWLGEETELYLDRDPAFDGVTTINNWAFSNCKVLTTLVLPNGVTAIGSGAFGYCSRLTTIALPSGLTSIGSGAFACCSRLSTIDIPYGMTKIGGGVFYQCSRLAIINSYPITPPTIENNTLLDCPAVIHVPDGSLAIYQSATHWSARAIIDDL